MALKYANRKSSENKILVTLTWKFVKFWKDYLGLNLLQNHYYLTFVLRKFIFQWIFDSRNLAPSSISRGQQHLLSAEASSEQKYFEGNHFCFALLTLDHLSWFLFTFGNGDGTSKFITLVDDFSSKNFNSDQTCKRKSFSNQHKKCDFLEKFGAKSKVSFWGSKIWIWAHFSIPKLFKT